MYGVDPVYIREGGSIPVTAAFEHDLGLPVVLLGFAQPACNAHAPNEWLLVENFERGTRVIVRLWDELAAASGVRAGPLTAAADTPYLRPIHGHRVGWLRAKNPVLGCNSRPSLEERKHVTTETGEAAKAAWRLEGPNGSMAPRSAIDVLVDLNEKVTTGKVGEYQPVPLGFTPLDKTIGAGLRAGELLLIGGAQGTGKTTMALQMARNVASGGQANVLYICFEHDELYLLNRLIAAESALAHLPHKTGAIKIQDVRKEILGTWMAEGGGAAQLAANPRLRPSLDRIARYGQNLFLLRGTPDRAARSTACGS